VADDENLEAIELGETGAQRAVVAVELISVQLDELVEEQIQIVGGIGRRDGARPAPFPTDRAGCTRGGSIGQFAFQRTDLIA